MTDSCIVIDTVSISLTFPRQETNNLISLCQQYRSKWTPQHYVNRWNLRSHEPTVEENYIRFQRLAVARRPIRIIMIRCHEKFAIIEAGDGQSGYILIRDDSSQVRNINMHGIIRNCYEFGCALTRVNEPFLL